MNGDAKKRIDKVQEKALENLDYILEAIPTPDFVDDSSGDPVRVKQVILVNFFGTLICSEPLPIGDDGTLWLEDGGFVWL